MYLDSPIIVDSEERTNLPTKDKLKVLLYTHSTSESGQPKDKAAGPEGVLLNMAVGRMFIVGRPVLYQVPFILWST